eukprot:scaffold21893_cov152-Isochrysis_galbana.AAC.1
MGAQPHGQPQWGGSHGMPMHFHQAPMQPMTPEGSSAEYWERETPPLRGGGEAHSSTHAGRHGNGCDGSGQVGANASCRFG